MKRLKELRQAKRLTLKQLSDELAKRNVKISADSLGKYERGARKPKYDKVLALAKYFNVSDSYLQGTTDDKDTYVINRIEEVDRLDHVSKVGKNIKINDMDVQVVDDATIKNYFLKNVAPKIVSNYHLRNFIVYYLNTQENYPPLMILFNNFLDNLTFSESGLSDIETLKKSFNRYIDEYVKNQKLSNNKNKKDEK